MQTFKEAVAVIISAVPENFLVCEDLSSSKLGVINMYHSASPISMRYTFPVLEKN
eukprot:c20261_g2_i1 orf=25-189(-)